MTDAIGQWLDAAGRYPVLSQEEVIELSRKIQQADPDSSLYTQLVNKLCNHNLRLVAKLTKGYMNGGRRLRWGDDITLDMLQEGYFGLRRAVAKFDPERGYTFSTYAAAWIRQALGRYHVDTASLIRVPDCTAREIFFLERHGFARPRAISWINRVIDPARAAYRLTSLDKKLQEDFSLLETISNKNRIGAHAGPVRTIDNRPDLLHIMSKCGIEPEAQKVIIAYCKRGHLGITLQRLGHSDNKANRQKVRSAIKKIQEYVA